MTKKLRIEFKYLDRNTCSRCRTTDKIVEKTLHDLQDAIQDAGVEVELKTTKLPISKLSQSNSVLINGIDIQDLINEGKTQRYTPCRGCSTIMDGSCDCRAYTYRGKKYTNIPKGMLREAIQKSLQKK